MNDTHRLSRRQLIWMSGALGTSVALGRTALSSEDADENHPVSTDYDDMPLLEGHEPLMLATAKTALVIVDMQRYFVHPAYAFTQTWEKLNPGCSASYFERVGKVVVPNCQKLQSCFRSLDAMIIYTEFGSLRDDGRDMAGWAREDNALARAILGKPMYPPIADPSCRVDDSLKPEPDELVLAKSTSGPLNSTKLDQMLHTLGVDTLVVTGVVTDVCVTQTAREFADRDFQVVVVEDACAGFVEERHDAALQTFANVFGHVRSTKAVIQLMSS